VVFVESTPSAFSEARLGGSPDEALLRHVMKPLLDHEKRELQAFVQVDMAHTVMLAECGILTADQAGSILGGLQEIGRLDVVAFPTQTEYGSLLLQIERYLTSRIGADSAGRMHTGRSRNDQSAAVSRIVSRDGLIDVAAALHRLQETILCLAQAHSSLTMPGYTHLQHAQPTTYGHYLMRHYATFARDQERIEGAFGRTNKSSLGGAAMVGTSWPLNRSLVAELLGHEGLVDNAYDAGIFTRDYPAENAAVLSILVNDVARLAGDLYLWSTWEFGLVELDDGLAGTSSIMPQKKNPFAIERVRGIAGLSIGWVPAMLGTLRSTSSSDLDLLFAPDPISDYVANTLVVVELTETILRSLTLKEEVMAERAGIFWTTTSGLADAIVREAGLPFREAHGVVGLVVRRAVEGGLTPRDVTSATVDAAAEQVLGRRLALGDDVVARALDVKSFLSSLQTTGSAHPDEVLRMVTVARTEQADHGSWLSAKVDLLEAARKTLASSAATYPPPGNPYPGAGDAS
jgi:argininosuccinate lyase